MFIPGYIYKYQVSTRTPNTDVPHLNRVAVLPVRVIEVGERWRWSDSRTGTFDGQTR